MTEHVSNFLHNPINGEIEFLDASGWAAAAAASAAEAAVSAAEAAAYAANALTYRNEAATFVTDAQNWALVARDWAIKLVDPVEGSDYSAKYNANLAAASYASTQAVYVTFTDKWLGNYASPPSLTPNGNTLAAGMVYFDTTLQEFRGFRSGAWGPLADAGDPVVVGDGRLIISNTPPLSVDGNEDDTWLDTASGAVYLKGLSDWTEESDVHRGYSAVITDTGTSRVLALTDRNAYIRMDNAGANTVTVPLNATVALPVNFVVHIRQHGAGQTSIVAGDPGVTINSDTLALRAQYSTLTLIKVGTDEWDIVGDMEAAA